jgi:hypothetical protein
MKKLALLFLLLFLAGCSVGISMSGTEKQDTSILFPGAPRQEVIAKMGPPETSTTNEAGERIDSYESREDKSRYIILYDTDDKIKDIQFSHKRN